MKENQNKENKKRIIIVILLVLIFLLVIGITFAWFRFNDFSKHINSITTGKLEVRLDEYDGKNIELLNTYPLTDNSGLKTKAYEFTIVNHSNYKLNYYVKLIEDEEAIKKCGCKNNLLDDSVLRYELKRNDSYINIDTLVNKEDWIIDNYKLDANGKMNYSLRLWLYENAGNQYMGKHFHAKIEVRVVEDK